MLWTDAAVLGPDARDTGIRHLATDGPWIVWIGRALGGAPGATRRVRLRGRPVSPGFVDAHVHLTPTGLSLGGLDLAGARSAPELRDALASFAARERRRFLWGTGWDDSAPGWRGRGPSRADLDAAAGDRFVYLTRVDSHSALVSSKLFEAAGCAGLDGAETGADGTVNAVVKRDAHHAARSYVFARMPSAQLASAQRTAARAAAAAGVTTVHEMSGPHVTAGERDLDVLLGQRERLPVSVVPYYATEDVRVPRERGLRQIGGDLNVDGSLGSRTAALRRPYADAPGNRGSLYRDAGALAEFLETATRAGLQAGVHCIGEAACEAAVAGLERAARRTGAPALRRMRHRLEHFEMSSRDLIARAARLGAALSVQPAFDREWGGDSGMYAARVGRARARPMNDFRAMARAGCICGFGSDSPVTPFDPLGGVRAAAEPRARSHAIAFADAFRNATLGGAALGREERLKGRLAVGYRADFVVWDGDLRRGAGVAATVCGGRLTAGRV
jgi:predicted amidohydrolase YtcJ